MEEGKHVLSCGGLSDHIGGVFNKMLVSLAEKSMLLL